MTSQSAYPNFALEHLPGPALTNGVKNNGAPAVRTRTSRLRSTGCKTCRQRKIKCDELKPVCRNCTKSRKGLSPTSTVPSQTHLYPRPRGNQASSRDLDFTVFDELVATSTEAELQQWPQQILGNGAAPVYDFHGSSGSGSSSPTLYEFGHPPTSVTGNSSPDSQGSEGRLQISSPIPTSAYRLETFFFQRFINSVWLHSQADAWKFYLPSVLNTSPALYYSVMSLSALYMYNTGADVRAKDMSLSLYQVTLTHLQKALYDPVLALQDTTLMATVIIGLYELIDKPGHDTWCSHSRGTAELLKIRGSTASRTGMGRMLFLTFRGFEIIRAILQQDETFAADPAWTLGTSNQNTILNSAGLLVDPERTDEEPTAMQLKQPIDHAAVLFMLGGQVANFQAKCARASREGQVTAALRQTFIQEAKAIESRLHTWRGNLPQVYNGRERPSVVPESPYSVIQEFDTFPQGYQLCFYSAFLLLLHRTIAKYILADVQQIPSTDQDYARFIIKTAEFLTQGLTTASLHVTWPVYMASISLRDERERRWTVTLLRTIVQDKGWAVANAALYAANVIARKNQARQGRPGVVEDYR